MQVSASYWEILIEAGLRGLSFVLTSANNIVIEINQLYGDEAGDLCATTKMSDPSGYSDHVLIDITCTCGMWQGL